MPFSGIEVTLNSNTYNDASFLDDGHQTNFLGALSDFLVEAGNVNTAKQEAETAQGLAEDAQIAAETAQTSAETAETNAETAQAGAEAARDLAETYRDQAQSAAAAASKGVPFTTTSGTGAAYTADFTPDLTAADANYFALNIHAANTTTAPTLAVEGGTAYPIVIGYDRRPIPIGLLDVGRNVILAFDGTNNEYAIIGGLPLFEFNRDINANGYDITGVGSSANMTVAQSIRAAHLFNAINFI